MLHKHLRPLTPVRPRGAAAAAAPAAAARTQRAGRRPLPTPVPSSSSGHATASALLAGLGPKLLFTPVVQAVTVVNGVITPVSATAAQTATPAHGAVTPFACAAAMGGSAGQGRELTVVAAAVSASDHLSGGINKAQPRVQHKQGGGAASDDGGELLLALRAWRQGRARRAGKQPSSVLPDQLLQVLAQRRPLTFLELQAVPGLVHTKAQQLGQELLDLIRQQMLRASNSNNNSNNDSNDSNTGRSGSCGDSKPGAAAATAAGAPMQGAGGGTAAGATADGAVGGGQGVPGIKVEALAPGSEKQLDVEPEFDEDAFFQKWGLVGPSQLCFSAEEAASDGGGDGHREGGAEAAADGGGDGEQREGGMAVVVAGSAADDGRAVAVLPAVAPAAKQPRRKRLRAAQPASPDKRPRGRSGGKRSRRSATGAAAVDAAVKEEPVGSGGAAVAAPSSAPSLPEPMAFDEDAFFAKPCPAGPACASVRAAAKKSVGRVVGSPAAAAVPKAPSARARRGSAGKGKAAGKVSALGGAGAEKGRRRAPCGLQAGGCGPTELEEGGTGAATAGPGEQADVMQPGDAMQLEVGGVAPPGGGALGPVRSGCAATAAAAEPSALPHDGSVQAEQQGVALESPPGAAAAVRLSRSRPKAASLKAKGRATKRRAVPTRALAAPNAPAAGAAPEAVTQGSPSSPRGAVTPAPSYEAPPSSLHPFLGRSNDASLKQYSREEDRWILHQVAAGRSELHVAAMLHRSHNAIVRRVRLLVSRATLAGAGGSNRGGAAADTDVRAAAVDRGEPAPTPSTVSEPDVGSAALPGNSGACSAAVLPAPATESVAAGVDPSAAAGADPSAAERMSEGAPAAVAATADAQPQAHACRASAASAVDPLEPSDDASVAAAVKAILRARAAATLARSTVSLPPHLLDPLIRCIRAGVPGAEAAGGADSGECQAAVASCDAGTAPGRVQGGEGGEQQAVAVV